MKSLHGVLQAEIVPPGEPGLVQDSPAQSRAQQIDEIGHEHVLAGYVSNSVLHGSGDPTLAGS